MEMIILTKSDKNSGYCVAGIDRMTGNWVRLVAYRRDDELSKSEITCTDGSVLDILDIVRVIDPMSKPYSVIDHQPENVALRRGKKLVKVGKATWKEVLRLHPAEIRREILNSKGEDCLPRTSLPGRSLQLIRVTDLSVASTGRRHPKISFSYAGNRYYITLTDPIFGPVRGTQKEAYLIVSLAGHMFKGAYYILGAKLITSEEVQNDVYGRRA